MNAVRTPEPQSEIDELGEGVSLLHAGAHQLPRLAKSVQTE
jgi:hypothetical protein